MLVQIKIINIFCVPILTSIKNYLAVPKIIIRSDKLTYCLSMTQQSIATSLIGNEPMTTLQIGLFLDKLDIQRSF